MACVLGAALLAVPTVSASSARPKPKVEVLGFATTLGNGKRFPYVQALNGGTIQTCRNAAALAAVFTIDDLPAGATYWQVWSRGGVVVFQGKATTLRSAITEPRTVYLAFSKNAPLPNGRYIFRLVVDGQPAGGGGSVTRSC